MIISTAATVAMIFLFLARAETAKAQDSLPLTPSMRLAIDNDLFALRGSGPPPDYDYTHGTRLSIAHASGPDRLARTLDAAPECANTDAIERGCLLLGLALGQEIYTPRHNTFVPVAGDRPHAALLYGAIQLQRLAGIQLQSIELRAGITGPPALGEQVQNGVHRLLRNHLEAGWDYQLPTRLGVAAEYDATRLLVRSSSPTPSHFVAASIGATFGTLRRAMRAGASAYYGFGQAHARSSDTPLVARPGRFYVLAGYQQSLVLYDAFIEGVGSVQGATRIPWVGEAYAGAGWNFRRFKTEYRYVSRGREYDAEPGRHAYGTIVLAITQR